MKKVIAFALMSTLHLHSMDISQKSTLLGFEMGDQLFSEDIQQKVANIMFYKNSTDLFPLVKILIETYTTGQDRESTKIVLEEQKGRLIGLESQESPDGTTQSLMLLQNKCKNRYFPENVKDIIKILSEDEQEMLNLQTIKPTLLTKISTIIHQPNPNKDSITLAQISYIQQDGTTKTIIGHINEPTNKKKKLGNYTILPVLIKHGRRFIRKEIPLAYITDIQARAKSTSPKASPKTPRKRTSSAHN